LKIEWNEDSRRVKNLFVFDPEPLLVQGSLNKFTGDFLNGTPAIFNEAAFLVTFWPRKK